jgi:hypothetical protein
VRLASGVVTSDNVSVGNSVTITISVAELPWLSSEVRVVVSVTESEADMVVIVSNEVVVESTSGVPTPVKVGNSVTTMISVVVPPRVTCEVKVSVIVTESDSEIIFEVAIDVGVALASGISTLVRVGNSVTIVISVNEIPSVILEVNVPVSVTETCREVVGVWLGRTRVTLDWIVEGIVSIRDSLSVMIFVCVDGLESVTTTTGVEVILDWSLTVIVLCIMAVEGANVSEIVTGTPVDTTTLSIMVWVGRITVELRSRVDLLVLSEVW